MLYRKTQKFGDLYFEATKPIFKKYGFANQGIVSQWRKIVGNQLANISSPQKINFPAGKTLSGTLIIGVINPAFSLAIQAQEARIIDKIATFFGYKAVSRIKIKVLPTKASENNGSMASNLKKMPNNKTQQIDTGLLKKIEQIRDEELREVLYSLALSSS